MSCRESLSFSAFFRFSFRASSNTLPHLAAISDESGSKLISSLMVQTCSAFAQGLPSPILSRVRFSSLPSATTQAALRIPPAMGKNLAEAAMDRVPVATIRVDAVATSAATMPLVTADCSPPTAAVVLDQKLVDLPDQRRAETSPHAVSTRLLPRTVHRASSSRPGGSSAARTTAPP